MAEKKSTKEVKKSTTKKPVDQQKTSKNSVEKSTKKQTVKKEVKVEPKRSKMHEENTVKVEAKRSKKEDEKKVIEEPISNDMIDTENDDKIWIVIALLLILLVGGAFVANKIVNNKKIEESSNNKIVVSKNVFENEDGTLEVKVKVKSKIGLKTITLEDGTVMNFNNKKEVEVKFTARENKEYTLIIKDKNGTKTRKKIKITQVKESIVKENEDQELVYEEPVTKPNYVVYYHRPQKNVQPVKVVENIPTFNIENNLFTNKDVTLKINCNVNYNVIIKKNGEEEKNYDFKPITEEGHYVVTATTTSGKQSTVEFTIDKTNPEFENIENGETYSNLVNVIAKDSNMDYYEITVGNYTYVEENIVELGNGSYTITAYDKAGNSKTISINVEQIISDNDSSIINGILTFNHSIKLNLDKSKIISFVKYNNDVLDDTFKYENDLITDAGYYELRLKQNDKEQLICFSIDYNKPVIDINGGEVNEDGNYEDPTITITDDSKISNAEYGYNNEENKNSKPENTIPYVKDEPITKPVSDDQYLWISATDVVGNETIAISDKPIQKETVVEEAINNNTIPTETK